jgi:ATP-dependent RNA helicase RhlE
MLDMGFVNDVYKVVEMLPQKRQSLFFSATMSPEVSKLARKMLTNPVTVEITPQATTVERIDQFVFFVDSENKNELILQLLRSKHLECVLIFTRTKHRANKVAQMLNKNRIPADAIHGNKSQTHRTKALQDFKSGQLRVLVATDIAARGIDVDDISHVVNYDLPNIPESYVHRIGRTARAGADGTAFSFCAADERDFLREIEKLIRMEVEVAEHEYHSEKAKNATGDAAKPEPRQYGRPRGKSGYKRGQGRGKKGEGKNKNKKSGSKKSGNNQSSRSSGNNSSGGRPKRNSSGKSKSSSGSPSKFGNRR